MDKEARDIAERLRVIANEGLCFVEDEAVMVRAAELIEQAMSNHCLTDELGRMNVVRVRR